MRLDKSEFLPDAPDEPGTVRINHESAACSGSSKSLKITRTDDDRVYAKCYRCGGFGSHMGRFADYSGYAKRVASSLPVVSNDLKMPHDFTNKIMDMPVEVRAKLQQYLIGQKDVDRYGLGWSKYWQRFIFPVYREKELKGFQARYYGDEDQPKYITRYKDDSDLWTYLPTDNPHPIDGCVLVEDMFSAIRVSKFCPSVALLGTELGDKCLDHVTNLHDLFLVFLDDDNLIVKQKAVKMKDSLTMVGKHAIIFTSKGTDPKEYNAKDLRDILTTYLSKR